MKIAHKLRSAEQISRRELERVLKGSLGTSFEVDTYQMEQMIEGIMKVRVHPHNQWHARSYNQGYFFSTVLWMLSTLNNKLIRWLCKTKAWNNKLLPPETVS